MMLFRFVIKGGSIPNQIWWNWIYVRSLVENERLLKIRQTFEKRFFYSLIQSLMGNFLMLYWFEKIDRVFLRCSRWILTSEYFYSFLLIYEFIIDLLKKS